MKVKNGLEIKSFLKIYLSDKEEEQFKEKMELNEYLLWKWKADSR